MSYPVFTVPAGDVLPVFFASYDGATGASEAITGLAVTDIEIYKDGSVTQRSSDAGYTLLDTDGIDFDGVVGINGFSIDTGDNTDAGFYTVGAWFHVVVASITADAQTVNFIACAFRIVAAEGVAGVPDVNTTHISDTVQTANDVGADVNDILVDTAVIGALGAGLTAVPWNAAWDAEVQSEVADALAVYDGPTHAELTAEVDAAQTDIAAVKADTAAILLDTAEIGAAGVGLTEAGGTGDHLTALATAAALATVDTEVGVIDGIVDSILVDTAEIGAAGAGLTALATAAAATAIEADTQNIQSRLPAALSGAGNIVADVLAVSGDATAADRLEAMMDASVVGQVNDVAATTTAFAADGFTESTDDHFIGRLITFTTGVLAGQQTAITDYTGATQTFTVVALTEAPADQDFFVIS